MEILITADTFLKINTRQSSELTDAEKQFCPASTEIDISAFVEEDNHIKFTISDRKDDIEGRNTWYCFKEHCQVKGLTVKPVQSQSNKGSAISLPGYDGSFYLLNPIYPGSNFTWSEATKNGTRMPPNKGIVDNIIMQAKNLDGLREANGSKPLVVTSWYRDPVSNRLVGGASKSDHLTGRSTDVYCPSMNIYKFQEFCISYWKHGGIGLGAGRGFVHLSSDGRVGTTWNY